MDSIKTDKKYEVLEGFSACKDGENVVSVGSQPNYSEGTLIRFYKSNGESFVANFPNKSKLEAEVYSLKEKLLILISGFAFVVNSETDDEIVCIGRGVEHLLKYKDCYVLGTFTHIIFLKQDGEIFTSKRISWDGLKDLKIDNNVLTGLAYDPTNSNQPWSPFILNLVTKEIQGGTYGIAG